VPGFSLEAQMQKVLCEVHPWEFAQIKKAAGRELSDPALWMSRVAVSVATGEACIAVNPDYPGNRIEFPHD
jgi:hypothetical protein